MVGMKLVRVLWLSWTLVQSFVDIVYLTELVAGQSAVIQIVRTVAIYGSAAWLLAYICRLIWWAWQQLIDLEDEAALERLGLMTEEETKNSIAWPMSSSTKTSDRSSHCVSWEEHE
jgi:hypothetical protein